METTQPVTEKDAKTLVKQEYFDWNKYKNEDKSQFAVAEVEKDYEQCEREQTCAQRQ